MKRLASRRTILLAVVTAAVPLGARADTGSATDLEVAMRFEGGGFVPKGKLIVYLDGSGGLDYKRQPTARTDIESDGRSEKITVSLSLPSGTNTSSPQQIVARLERADGWLLARGSAQLNTGLPVSITLYTVMH